MSEPKYPSIAWVRSNLRYNLHSHSKDKVLAAYIVGSEAKGTAKSDSDIDIALIVSEQPRLTALKKTERYHQKFAEEGQKPAWQGRVVDFQFFYENDPEFLGYSKIKISENNPLAPELKAIKGGIIINYSVEETQKIELPWGIYNKYAEEWWIRTDDNKRMEFPTELAAHDFIARLAEEDEQICCDDEAFVTQSAPTLSYTNTPTCT